MTVITGEGISIYRAVALKVGLKLYVRTGLKPNGQWTITKMLKAASGITGKAYKRSQANEAIQDLGAWLDEHAK
jgi:hypothetical protein